MGRSCEGLVALVTIDSELGVPAEGRQRHSDATEQHPAYGALERDRAEAMAEMNELVDLGQ